MVLLALLIFPVQKDLVSPAQSDKMGKQADLLQTDDYTAGSTDDSGLDERHFWTIQSSHGNVLSQLIPNSLLM